MVQINKMRIFLYFIVFLSSFINVYAKYEGIYKTDKQKAMFEKLAVSPRQIGNDPRFKSFSYTPETTYKLVTIYDNPSYIEFEAGESVSTIMNPKKTAWQLISSGNRLFIKPEENNADTTITVMTNKRVYYFEMHAFEPEGSFDPNYTISLIALTITF